MNKKILIITCHRLSDNTGGPNASKGIIHAFSRLYDNISVICPEFDDNGDIIPIDCTLYQIHDTRCKLMKGVGMYFGIVNAIYGFVKSHLKAHHYDVIVIDHSVTGTSLVKTLKKTGATLVTIHHNVERDYLNFNGNERPVLYRYPYNYFAKKAERECLEYSDINITLTESDAQTFRSWYPEKDIHAVSLGICDFKGIPNKIFYPTERHNKFVITGSLNFIQSLQPIKEFIASYYTILQEECPDHGLVIAGRNPSEELIDICAQHSNITIIPNPSKMSEVIADADYYICPINAGSGMKLRLTDGLKEGLPIICHEVSTAGYEPLVKSGVIFSYSDKDSFRESLQEMLHSTLTKECIYTQYQELFSVETKARQLAKILHTINE